MLLLPKTAQFKLGESMHKQKICWINEIPWLKMKHFLVNRELLLRFLTHLQNSFAATAEIYLIGQTLRLMEKWVHLIEEIEFAANVSQQNRTEFEDCVADFRRENQIKIVEESPEEVIPLPEGYHSRRREVSTTDVFPDGKLKIYHFDPYSVAFRYIARGDEQDYHLVLNFLEHGWIAEEEMTAMLDKLVPRFSFQTIHQDPAEFRRRYKGLLQMWHSVEGRNQT